MIRRLTMMLALVAVAGMTFAQVSLTALSTPVTLDFTGFAGAGVSNAPLAGMLDSDDWAFTGFSSGDLPFGGTDTTSGSDYTKGITTGDIFSGGLYAFDNGFNQAIYIQPTGSDWTPGSATLRVQNNTGGDVNELEVDYFILVKNNEGRSNSFNLSYSTDDVAYVNVTSADYNSVEAEDTASIVDVVTRSVVISGISVVDGGFIYLRWSGNDETGAGSRDEFGLDNITIEAVPAGGTPIFNLSASAASGSEGDAAITLGVGLSTAADCTVDVNITGGSATSGVDYTGASTTLTFTLAGATSMDFSIMPIDDADLEMSEDVTFELANATGGCILGAVTAGVMTIDDNETAAFGECANLYFSEYVEGTSSNKFFEIYNPTSATVDLSAYTVSAFNNGSTTPTNTLSLTGMLAAGDVYVIANPSADSATLAMSDISSTVTFINGDDAVILLNGSDTIDAIGRVGEDPGTNWPVDTGATSEYTLVRKAAVKQGQLDWNVGATEWDVYAQDDFSFLFAHTQDACAPAVCSSATPPTGLMSVNGATNVALSWNPIPSSVACQVKGNRITPPGPSPSVNIIGAEPSSTNVPYAAAGAATTWTWSVRCACSISPLDATSFSVLDTFSIPAAREAAKIEMTLFPNPATDFVRVAWNNETANSTVELIDLMGRVLASVQANGNTVDMDLSSVEAGVYFVRVNDVVAGQVTVVE